MKSKNHSIFFIIGVILSGLIVVAIISVNDKEEISLLINKNQTRAPKSYNAASVSKGTILLLLALGVIGVLGVSRKKKDIGSSAQRNESPISADHQNLKQDKPEL